MRARSARLGGSVNCSSVLLASASCRSHHGLTFAEAADRWLADFEAKVTAGERRDRTLDLYRSQLHCHLLPRLGRRQLALITTGDVVAVMHELQTERLSPWTIKRILGALSCVFTFALRR